MSGYILAITPNPAIDKTVVVCDYCLGAINRPERLVALAGGKGLNVARAIRRLGGDVRACVLLGGHSGRWIAEQLHREGIPCSSAWFEGETRSCLSIFDPNAEALTELYEQGALITSANWDEFEQAIGEVLGDAALAVCSGSLPPGAPPDGYARLVRAAQERSVSVFLDTHGEPLRLALDARPHLVKINRAEISELVGRTVETVPDVLEAGETLLHSHTSTVIVTLGAGGAVALSGEGRWHAIPPQVEAVAPVGSGDALLGGLAVALSRGDPLPEALRLGVAAGAANTLTFGTGIIDRQTTAELAGQVNVITLREE